MSSPVNQPHATCLTNQEEGRPLALVQDGLVISIFPEHQRDAAVDLARVLCRALGQAVGIYQRCHLGERVETGASSEVLQQREWTQVVKVTPSLLARVEVEFCEPTFMSLQPSNAGVAALAVT